MKPKIQPKFGLVREYRDYAIEVHRLACKYCNDDQKLYETIMSNKIDLMKCDEYVLINLHLFESPRETKYLVNRFTKANPTLTYSLGGLQVWACYMGIKYENIPNCYTIRDVLTCIRRNIHTDVLIHKSSEPVTRKSKLMAKFPISLIQTRNELSLQSRENIIKFITNVWTLRSNEGQNNGNKNNKRKDDR